jgi:hypothetical protein
MPVTTEGKFQAQIKKATVVDPRFSDMDPNSYELEFMLILSNGEEGETYLEVSGRMGKGNMSDRNQTQITMDTLEKIGWTHGLDFSKLDTLVNKVVNVNVSRSKNGKYINVYFDGGIAVKPISAQEIARRTALMTGQAQPQTGFAQPQQFGQQPQQFGQQPQAVTPFQQPQQVFQQPQQPANVFAQPTQFQQPQQFAPPVDPFAAGRMAPAPQFQR